MLTGAGAINGTGNSLANTITGNTAANTLSGSRRQRQALRRAAATTTICTAVPATTCFLVVPTTTSSCSTRRSMRSTDRDTITDFNHVDDTIWLENAVFTKLGVAGALNAAAFWTGTAAHDANDRIIYNKATGALYYDADGNGAGAAVQFATLTTKPALAANDFVVI